MVYVKADLHLWLVKEKERFVVVSYTLINKRMDLLSPLVVMCFFLLSRRRPLFSFACVQFGKFGIGLAWLISHHSVNSTWYHVMRIVIWGALLLSFFSLLLLLFY
jgi:hypothetical protein